MWFKWPKPLLALDVALIQTCAEEFDITLKKLAADGGEAEGVIEWIPDLEKAKGRTRCVYAHAAGSF